MKGLWETVKINSKLKELRPKYFTLYQLRQAELMDDVRNFTTFPKKTPATGKANKTFNINANFKSKPYKT